MASDQHEYAYGGFLTPSEHRDPPLRRLPQYLIRIVDLCLAQATMLKVFHLYARPVPPEEHLRVLVASEIKAAADRVHSCV